MSKTMISLPLQSNGVGTVIGKLPARKDYLALVLTLKSGTFDPADASKVVLYGNTEPLHQYNQLIQLNTITKFDKFPVPAAPVAGEVVARLDFERIGMKGSYDATYGATLKINAPLDGDNQGGGSIAAKGLPLGTPVFTSGSIQFDVAASGGTANPEFELWAEVELDIDEKTGAGPTMRRKGYQKPYGTANTEERYSDLAFGNKQFRHIRRAFIYNDSGVVNRVRLLMDGVEKFDRKKPVNDFVCDGFDLHTRQAYYPFVLDFTENGMPEDLDTLGAGTLEWAFTCDTPGQIFIVVEYGGVAF